jgi:acetyl-CoA acetyltransferase
MTTLRDRAAIVGIGQTDFSPNSGRTETVLALQAVSAAIADAGLSPRDVDGIVRYSYDSTTEALLTRTLGIPRLGFYGEIGYGGFASAATVAHAAAAIASGMAHTVVVYRSLNERSGVRFGRAERHLRAGSEVTLAPGDRTPMGAFSGPYGLLAPGQCMALWARRYMHEYGVSGSRFEEILGTIAITQRTYANANPNAMMRDRPLTLEQYRQGRMISTPLRVYDYCLETDGACALVLTAAERAHDLPRRPIYVSAAVQSLSPHSEPVPVYTPSLTQLALPAMVEQLYGMAGVSADDIDVASFYDATSPMILFGLEDWRFAKRGEGGDLIVAGGIARDGRIPVNTSGGHLSEAYIHGMNLIAEVVKQLRGTAYTQVNDAEVGLVVSAGASALVLRR